MVGTSNLGSWNGYWRWNHPSAPGTLLPEVVHEAIASQLLRRQMRLLQERGRDRSDRNAMA